MVGQQENISHRLATNLTHFAGVPHANLNLKCRFAKKNYTKQSILRMRESLS